MAIFHTWKFIQKKHQIIPQKWQSIFWILLFIIRKKKLFGLWTFEKNGFFGFLDFWIFDFRFSMMHSTYTFLITISVVIRMDEEDTVVPTPLNSSQPVVVVVIPRPISRTMNNKCRSIIYTRYWLVYIVI